jgi:hypothetical protein
MGELVRSVTVRRIDWPVGLALVFSLSAVSFSLPQWRTAKTLPVLFSPAKGSALAKAYQFHLGPAAGVLAAGLFLYFLFKFAAPSRTEAPKREQSLEPFEVVALLMFVLMPFLAFVLARVTGAPLFGRYSISTVGGFACLFGVVSARRAPVGLGVLFILITQIGLNLFDYSNSVAIIEPSTSLALNTTPYAFAARYEMMETVPNKNLPIVFLDDFEFLPLVHYAPPKLASRLVYILVPGLDVNGESQRVLQRLSGAPGKIDTMANFLSTHDAFLVQSNARSLYRLNYFIQEGGDVRVENASTDSFLASVTIKKGHGELAFNMLQ